MSLKQRQFGTSSQFNDVILFSGASMCGGASVAKSAVFPRN